MRIDLDTLLCFIDHRGTVGFGCRSSPNRVGNPSYTLIERDEEGTLRCLKACPPPETWEDEQTPVHRLTPTESEQVLHALMDTLQEVFDARSSP